MAAAPAPAPTTKRPKAMVYRGPAATEGCPESVAHVLRTSPQKFEVIFAGPKEKTQISAETLSEFDIFAQPGGPDLDLTWPIMKPHADAIRDFVSDGGTYLGFCLGAYMAGSWHLDDDDDGEIVRGYELLPEGTMMVQECEQSGAQVSNEDDAVLEVDWRFSTGSQAGKTRRRWMYFQDGPAMMFKDDAATAKAGTVLARYSSTGDVAAYVTSYGKGSVAVVGPHPEATKSWYKDEGLKNPNGYNLDMAYDFVEASWQHRSWG